MRTPPHGHDHVPIGSKGWRPFPRGSRSRGPFVPPGVYTVKLTAGDRSVTQKLVVKKDPHSAGTESDIQAQTKIMLEIYDKLDLVADLINQIEWIRKQIYDLKDLLNKREEMQSVINAADALDEKLIDIEGFFFSMGLTGLGDALRWPDKFYVKLRFLANDIGKSDFAPTRQQIEVHEMFTEQLADLHKSSPRSDRTRCTCIQQLAKRERCSPYPDRC